MDGKNFSEVIDLIVKEDSRYDKGAYFFVRRALDHTLNGMKGKELGRKSAHISGGELLDGIREYALDQYGPMTLTLFEDWGLRECADFGEIVFNLVAFGIFGKTESDKKEDFEKGYDFRDAFSLPFLPKSVKRNNGRKVKEGEPPAASGENPL